MSRTRNIQYIDYADNYQALADKLIEWQELKPDNSDISEMISNMTKIAFHVANMQMEIEDLGAQMRDYRHKKNVAIERMRDEQYNKANGGNKRSI